MQYLIGLDIGTTGVKGLLLDSKGNVVFQTRDGYEVVNPRSGWAEQDPRDWWGSTKNVLKKLTVEVNEEQIAGISLTGQMHSAVFLDDKNNVIRPAILWCDTRTSKECREIERKTGGRKNLIRLTSNKALEGFTAPKIMWLKNNEPENFSRLNTVTLPKDYIRFRLTGKMNMEYSDAAGTLLFDVENKQWNPEIFQKLSIDMQLMPEVIPSTTTVGRISSKVAKKTGLNTDTFVIAGGADNACGAVGSGVFKEGRIMASLGSSGVVLAPVKEHKLDEEGRLHLFNHASENIYYYMGVMLSAGQSFKWLKEKILPENWSYDKINRKAKNVDPGSEGLLFLPYLYGERTPHADSDARGVFFGLSTPHKKGHLARSVMEGVTFGLRDSLDLVESLGVEIDRVRAIGGGARSEVWQQILADVFNKPIELLEIEEGPAYGAAILAGIGTGVFESFDYVDENLIGIREVINPQTNKREIYDELYDIYQKLYLDLKDTYTDLARIRDKHDNS